MKNLNLYIISVVTLLVVGYTTSINAQQIPILNQYMFQPEMYNPAAIGGEKGLEAFLNYRKQWFGHDNAPTSQVISLSGSPLKNSNKMGIGLFVENDQPASFLGGLRFHVQYAYHILLTDNHDFSLGVAAGIANRRIKYTETMIANPEVLWALQDYNSTKFDAGFGLNYAYKSDNLEFKLGVAGQQLPSLLDDFKVEPTFTIAPEYNVNTHLLANLAVRFNVSNSIGIEPTILYRGAIGKGSTGGGDLDLGARFIYMGTDRNDKVWLGGGYRTNGGGYQISLGIIPQRNVNIFGSFELNSNLGSSAEVGVGFVIGRPITAEELEAKKIREEEKTRLAEEKRLAAEKTAEAKAIREAEEAKRKEAEIAAKAEREAAARTAAEKEAQLKEAAAKEKAEQEIAEKTEKAAKDAEETRLKAERDAAAKAEKEAAAAAKAKAKAEAEAATKTEREAAAAAKAKAKVEAEAAAKAEREAATAAKVKAEAEAEAAAKAEREAATAAKAKAAIEKAKKEAEAKDAKSDPCANIASNVPTWIRPNGMQTDLDKRKLSFDLATAESVRTTSDVNLIYTISDEEDSYTADGNMKKFVSEITSVILDAVDQCKSPKLQDKITSISISSELLEGKEDLTFDAEIGYEGDYGSSVPVTYQFGTAQSTKKIELGTIDNESLALLKLVSLRDELLANLQKEGIDFPASSVSFKLIPGMEDNDYLRTTSVIVNLKKSDE